MIISSGLRKFALAVHLTVSVGWIGAVAAYLVLDVSTVTSQEPEVLRAAYRGMDLIARNAIVPLALASLVTGLVVSLGTRWGLFRHYWVLISFFLTTLATAVLLSETRTIGHLADIAADPRMSADGLRTLASTLPHSIGGTVVLLVILVLNIYKPKGLTRYGRRRQKQERGLDQSGRLGDRTSAVMQVDP